MRIAELTADSLLQHLSSDGLGIDFGAARARVRTALPAVAHMLQTVYGGYPADDPSGMFDVTVDLRRVRGVRGVIRPQCELLCDGVRELEPFPLDTPLPLLEWGTNYALATRLFFYLLLHAGVVERDGRAIVMPAMPGSGKSTLTAALTLRGFRLLSDEFGVVRLSDARMLRMLRPLALKNESIDVIARFEPSAVIGPRFPKTHKGTVAHLAPQRSHVDARHEPANPALVVFPRFDRTTGVELEPVKKTRAFARLAVNSFNYHALGPDGFDALGQLVHESSCWQLRYGDLDGAIQALGDLLDETRSADEAVPSTHDAHPVA
ncbi:MAG TPA: HprK-related kinase A [Burkholderiaceae bacterium]|nr:HprK-related kinase A [Burkholderiaceae bacterium]